MRRQWHTVRTYQLEGSERSLQLAHALAQKCDPDTLEKLLEAKALLDAVGGRVYIAAFRTKYDRNGQPLEDVRQPGRYETDGYIFHYEHIAKLPRPDTEEDIREQDVLPIDVPADLRDEIEAEVDALIEADQEPDDGPDDE